MIIEAGYNDVDFSSFCPLQKKLTQTPLKYQLKVNNEEQEWAPDTSHLIPNT